MEKEVCNKNKQIKIGLIISYFNMAVSIISYLVFTPFYVNKLGDVEYGLRSLAASISSYLTILSLGLSSAYIRYRILYIKNLGEDGEKKFNGLYFLVFLIIGIVALIIGIISVVLIKNNIIILENYSNSEISILCTLLIISTINISLSFPFSIFTQSCVAHEEFIWVRSITLLSDVLTVVFNFVVLYLGYKSIAMSIVALIVNVLTMLLNFIFAVNKMKMSFSFKLDKNDLRMLKDMISFSIFVGINMIVDELNSHTDPIIIGILIGAEAVTIFNLGRQFRSYLVTMSTMIYSSFSPRINQYVLNNESEKTNRLFLNVAGLQLLILFLIVGGFASCGKEFISLWVGQNKIDAYYVAIFVMFISVVPLSQNTSLEVQRAMKKHKFRAIVYLVIAVTNVAISIILCKKIGMFGCIIGTCVTLVLGQYICIGIYNQKVIGLPINRYWLLYLRFSIPMLIATACTFLLNNLTIGTFYMMLVKGVTFVLIYIIINFLVNKKIIKNILMNFKNNTF